MDTADLLVCGSCLRNFPLGNIVNFVQHKKFDCSEQELCGYGRLEGLACQSCPLQFGTPWSLLKHAQNVHSLKIYLEKGFAQHQNNENEPPELSKADALLASEESYRTSCDTWVLKNSDDEAAAFELQSGEVVSVKTAAQQACSGAVNNSSYATLPPSHPLPSIESHRISTALGVDASVNVNPLQQLVVDGEENGRLGAILEKCCTAVVPKKRKRHMEIKHGGGNSRKRTLGMQSTPTSIYIDLEAGSSSSGGQVLKASLSRFQGNEQGNKMSSSSLMSGTLRRHSVIIQPGTTFSIPVSYTNTVSMSSSSGVTYDAPAESEQCFRESRPGAEASVAAAAAMGSGEVSTGSTGGVSKDVLGYDDKQERDASLTLLQKRRRYPTSRPFKCDQCNDSFNQRVHLRKHQSKHTGVKPFKCDQCDYSTVERSHLKVHIRVHTGERPYKCTFCKYATAQNSTLKIHLKRHHLDTISSSSVVAPLGCLVASSPETSSAVTPHCTDCAHHFRQQVSASNAALSPVSTAVLPPGENPSKPTTTTLTVDDQHHNYALMSNKDSGGPEIRVNGHPLKACQKCSADDEVPIV